MDAPRIMSELHSELAEIEQEIQILERTDIETIEATAHSVSGTGREPDSYSQ